MQNKALSPIVDGFTTRSVLVIGDFILDVYLEGTSHRLSPEAPVPVVDVQGKTMLAGGAGNTAANLAALGARVTFCTVLGGDAEGRHALLLLNAAGVDTQSVIVDDGRQTIVKTRVLADHQQHMIRFDAGDETAIGGEAEETLVQYIRDFAPAFNAVIVSDYNKGVVTGRVLRALCEVRPYCSYVAVDSKRLPFFRPLRPCMAKPNYLEAVALAGEKPRGKNRLAQIARMCRRLYTQTGADIVAVTMDSDGSVLLDHNSMFHHERAMQVQLSCVSGAGDTYISAFALAALADASPADCAYVASCAAGIAVAKANTAHCTGQELKEHMGGAGKVACSVEALARRCDKYRAEGKRIVFTNGCFDILHHGHVSYLNAARTRGDVLIVAVNTDDSIRRLKGSSRPINNLNDRLNVLAALQAVDHLVAFGDVYDDTPAGLIRALRPHVFAKGEDYAHVALPEAEALYTVGCEVQFIPLVPDRSTTKIIERIHLDQEALNTHDQEAYVEGL